MVEAMYSTRRCIPENSSSIDVLLAEANTEGVAPQETDIARKICEVDNSITRLQEVYSELKSDYEIGVIGKIIGNLNTKRARLIREQARQLNLQQSRDASKDNLESRVRQRLAWEIRNIHNQSRKDGRTTPNKITAAYLAAYGYNAIIFGDLLDNQPQERNNHDS